MSEGRWARVSLLLIRPHHYAKHIMQLTVNNVPSRCVCLSAGHNCELYNHGWADWGAIWGMDSGGNKEPRIRQRPWSPGRAIFVFGGGILCPIVKYREYPTQSQYSQPYLGGGSSNAACCCQYCSNLFLHFNHWRQRWLCAALWYQRDASASVIDCWVAEFTGATAVWVIHGLVGDSRHEIIVMRRTTRQAGHLISRLSIKPTMLRRTDWPSCGFTSHSTDAKWVISEKFPEASFLAWHGKNQSKHPKSTHSPIKRNVLKHKINTKNWNQV